MAFFDFLKREDGSWDIKLIIALVLAVLAGFSVVYVSYSMARPGQPVKQPVEQPVKQPVEQPVEQLTDRFRPVDAPVGEAPYRPGFETMDKISKDVDRMLKRQKLHAKIARQAVRNRLENPSPEGVGYYYPEWWAVPEHLAKKMSQGEIKGHHRPRFVYDYVKPQKGQLGYEYVKPQPGLPELPAPPGPPALPGPPPMSTMAHRYVTPASLGLT